MSKYDPLWKHIESNAVTTLTFDEVEEVCGFPIDHSFLAYKKELTEHGYKVSRISMKEKTVKFEKC